MHTWTTRNGLVIPLVELEDSHLKNIIAFIERIGEGLKFQEWAEAFKAYCTLRGEAAQNCAEADLDRLLEMSVREYLISRSYTYWFLLCLAVKRGVLDLSR